MSLLVATERDVLFMTPGRLEMTRSAGLDGLRPTCLAAGSDRAGMVWCGTHGHGVYLSEDGGRSWRAAGLEGRRVMALTSSPVRSGLVWAGTEPSEVWVTRDAGTGWLRTGELNRLPSSPEWAFPPKPETHHVRWIACHPSEPNRLWVAIEAGALISTTDGGRTWRDRVLGGPYDTHELAIHPERPQMLRVAAGDGYFESPDGGQTWSSPMAGLEVGYLRSVTVDPGDPDVVLVSAASHPYRAYGAGVSDGRIYRRVGTGSWQRVTAGWPDPPSTIAPLLAAGQQPGEVWAADERGVHASRDGGSTWQQIAAYPLAPRYLRGLVPTP
jgi:photosystem II stability/assembly factor-like uncharacterized protein